jgi:hypothetical protein
MPPFVLFMLGMGGFALGLLLVAILAALVFGVPRQARRRGHGFWSWFVLQILATNPVYPLVLVAMLPDRAKGRLREQYAAELDAKLQRPTSGVSAKDTLTLVPDKSVGDLPTLAPPDRSIGDAPTV